MSESLKKPCTSFTTAPPQVDVENLYPFLKGTAKQAIRLHPRRIEMLAPTNTKIGGSICWPADDPLPRCQQHGCLAVPVLQLTKRDFPGFPFPDGMDVFQLLWFPQSYKECRFKPKPLVYWRRSSEVSNFQTLTPHYVAHSDLYVVQECAVCPEAIVEYPDISALSEEHQQRIWEQESDDDELSGQYQYCLSTCAGSKLGGYPAWGGQDAQHPRGKAGKRLDHLLTLCDDEWDGGSGARWRPLEISAPKLNRQIENFADGSTLIIVSKTEPEDKGTVETRLAAQAAMGTHLGSPYNLLVDFQTDPWSFAVA